MKVKYLKNKRISGNTDLINTNLNDFLQAGKDYEVYRLRSDGNFYFLIFDDSHFIEVPFQMVEIIDGTLPNNWVISVIDDVICIGPEFFNSEFWFDDFSELPEYKRREFVHNL